MDEAASGAVRAAGERGRTSFLSAYAPRPGIFDEMTAGGPPGEGGEIRPHWRDFAGSIAALPAEALQRRWERGQRMLLDHGASFQLRGGEPLGRPWQLDPMPLLISAEEWQSLSEGLVQRASLLDALLVDLYGPRRMLAQGKLPPALVLGHPEYLRACRGFRPAGGRYLTLYAADLARGPDGRWMVVADRCEAPAGMGYALENRQVMGRILAEEMRAGSVEPLQPFFQEMAEALGQMSPRRFETPRLVLLTPGPQHDTYFEQVYLARHLGCTLVESEDLATRDGRLFLKTLDGLKPVDVMLRFARGGLCDPVELSADSMQGVAGMTQAARNGSVAMSNALGSGVVEAAGLAPFLPEICRALLGEGMLLQGPETLWCGDERQAREALARMGELVLRPAVGRGAGTFGDGLTADGREDLAARIRARPHAFAAQAPVAPSTAPVWVDGRPVPRPLVLRVFVVARRNGYAVMPGGLARVSEDRALPTLTLQGGEGGSKDVWVRTPRASVAAQASRTAPGPVVLTRGGRDLPSRVADNLYWFGRYLERCEGTTRMLRSAFARAEDMAQFGPGGHLALLALLSPLGAPPTRDKPKTIEEAMAFLGRLHFQPAGSGLRATTDRLYRTAAAARDRLSMDTWRTVQRITDQVASLSPEVALDLGEAQGRLDDAVLTLQAGGGLAMENMTRGLGWRFLDVGRRIERAGQVIDLLANLTSVDEADMGPSLDVLLSVFDSVMTYRARYLSAPQFAPVLDLLMCDESNPRSLGFQLSVLSGHMDKLVAFRDAARIRPEQRLMVFLEGTVRTADVDHLAEPDEDGQRYELAKLLEVLRSRVWELSEVITNEYFTHAGRRATPWRHASPP